MVNPKLLGYVFGASKEFPFFCRFANVSGGRFDMPELFGRGGGCLCSDARVVPRISDQPRMLSLDKNVPLSLRNSITVK